MQLKSYNFTVFNLEYRILRVLNNSFPHFCFRSEMPRRRHTLKPEELHQDDDQGDLRPDGLRRHQRRRHHEHLLRRDRHPMLPDSGAQIEVVGRLVKERLRSLG